ncbi:MAG: hypothetical protein FWD57_03150 [Polyangiaceae bacterium]|nr:hypothetical protein [Polyangiaceae bacterium]
MKTISAGHRFCLFSGTVGADGADPDGSGRELGATGAGGDTEDTAEDDVSDAASALLSVDFVESEQLTITRIAPIVVIWNARRVMGRVIIRGR